MTKRRLKKHVESWRDLLAPSECLSRFKNRLSARLAGWHAHLRNRNEVEDKFAFLAGHPVPLGQLDRTLKSLTELTPEFHDFGQSCIHKAIVDAKSKADVCFVTECIHGAVRDHAEASLPALEKAVREAVESSPGIGISFSIQGQEFTVRPAGDHMLDKAVVDDVLLSLSRQPAISKHFQAALSICASGETARFRNALDNLRFGLEALLKKILENTKSLENQKPVLLPWLKAHGLHQQVVNMYESLLFGPYAIYQNDAVKHTERYSPVEVEFMIYLTGTFMRLLLDLSAKVPTQPTPQIQASAG